MSPDPESDTAILQTASNKPKSEPPRSEATAVTGTDIHKKKGSSSPRSSSKKNDGGEHVKKLASNSSPDQPQCSSSTGGDYGVIRPSSKKTTSSRLKWIGHKSKNTLNGCLQQSPQHKASDGATVAETVVPSTLLEEPPSLSRSTCSSNSKLHKNGSQQQHDFFTGTATVDKQQQRTGAGVTPAKKQQQQQHQMYEGNIERSQDSSYHQESSVSLSSSFSNSNNYLNVSFDTTTPPRTKYYTQEKAYITPLASPVPPMLPESENGEGTGGMCGGDLASRMALVLPSLCFLPPKEGPSTLSDHKKKNPSSGKSFSRDIHNQGIAPRGKTCFSGCNPFRKSQNHELEEKRGTEKKIPFLSLSDRSARRQRYAPSKKHATINVQKENGQQQQQLLGTPQTTILSPTPQPPPLPTNIGVVKNNVSNSKIKKQQTTSLQSPRHNVTNSSTTLHNHSNNNDKLKPSTRTSTNASPIHHQQQQQQFSDDPPGSRIKDKNTLALSSFDDPDPFQPRLEEIIDYDDDSEASRAARRDLASAVSPANNHHENVDEWENVVDAYDPEVEVVVFELDAKADSKQAEYLKLARLRSVPQTIVLDIPMRPVSPLHFTPPKKEGFVRQDCLCGHHDECNGVSAGFFLLEDPRSGYMEVPKKKRITSQIVLNANRHRERLLFHIAKLSGQQQRYNGDDSASLYIAKHHFHPQIIFSQPTANSQQHHQQHHDFEDSYIFPYHITTKLADELCMPLTERDRVRENFDQHMADYYFTLPTYNMDRAKRDLKTRVRASRLSIERQEHTANESRVKLTRQFSPLTKKLSIKDYDDDENNDKHSDKKNKNQNDDSNDQQNKASPRNEGDGVADVQENNNEHESYNIFN